MYTGMSSRLTCWQLSSCLKTAVFQAQDLGKAKWEFENTRNAFQETMSQFAPGFGAGTFLARAIAKRSALVINFHI